MGMEAYLLRRRWCFSQCGERFQPLAEVGIRQQLEQLRRLALQVPRLAHIPALPWGTRVSLGGSIHRVRVQGKDCPHVCIQSPRGGARTTLLRHLYPPRSRDVAKDRVRSAEGRTAS
jgi:hypothetical protein